MSKEQEVKRTSIGGQALIEGVMMRGPKKSTMAVRHVSGEILTESWDNLTAQTEGVRKIPFVRGIFNFVDSLRTGYKALMRSAVLSGLEDEDEPSDEKKKDDSALMTVLMVISSILGIGLAVVLFMWLPSFLCELLQKVYPLFKESYFRAVSEGVLRLVIFVAYLSLTSLMKDLRRVYMYHGAEHKTIFCYEHGLPLTVENVQKQSRFHPRCGTSFMVLMLLVGILVSIFIPTSLNSLVRTAVKILCLPLVVGIGYEAIKLAGRKDNWFTKAISAPGLWVQRITTKEPTPDMIECAIAAFTDVIPENEEEDKW